MRRAPFFAVILLTLSGCAATPLPRTTYGYGTPLAVASACRALTGLAEAKGCVWSQSPSGPHLILCPAWPLEAKEACREHEEKHISILEATGQPWTHASHIR